MDREEFESRSEAPVSLWIEQLAAGNRDAVQELWQHFSERLVQFSRSKLDVGTRRLYDEDDASASAFRSLCRGIESRKYGDISDRGNLWALLLVIASRKISNQRRFQNQLKRSCSQTIQASEFQGNDSRSFTLFDQMASAELTPAFAAEVSETSEKLLEILPEPDLQKIVLLKFEGFTNEEVAEQIGTTRRTIQRKLERIRRIWLDSGLCDDQVSEN